MGIIQRTDGWQPVCNDCGIVLGITLTEIEYQKTKDFWKNWNCIICTKHGVGSFAKWLATYEEAKHE